MPFSHYPKTVDNIVMAWVQPPPPDIPPQEGFPDFLGRPFSAMNRWREAVSPGKTLVGYHDAQPFTRLFGSIACDQPLDVSLAFSNDEVDVEGHWITDKNIDSLHYDAYGTRRLYDPTKQEQTGHFFTMIFGRFVRVEIKNIGNAVPSFQRVYVRGSVF